MEGVEVIGLHDHVVHLEESEPVIAGQTALIAVSRQHPVHGEMDPHAPEHVHIVQFQ